MLHEEISNENKFSVETEIMPEEAIIVRQARKCYTKGKAILDGLNMTVSRGSIYGLLGASGCGKTTLLSCAVGVRQLNSGEIWILGGKPGSVESGVPGCRVGYMPQEVSLVQEFTVIGAMYYFGRINGLDDEIIDERYEFLSDLLELPPRNRLVKHMSGGQQRRVSFAVSLIHKPELLILDEPTVGLDPILREKIWKFLVKITEEEGVAVVITTHYIEEAKSAHKIGLMRCGKLLAETTPNELLQRCQCDNLEEAFYILSSQQQKNMEKQLIRREDHDFLPKIDVKVSNSISTPQSNLHNSCQNIIKNEKELLDNYDACQKKARSSVKTFQALITKNILQFVRHPGGILFAFIFPLVQVYLFFNAIGGDPKGTVLAVVNDEAGDCNYGLNRGSVFYDSTNDSCDFVDLSCRFLEGFDDSIAIKKYFDSLQDATEAVRSGKAVSTMYFHRNFSTSLQNRIFLAQNELPEIDMFRSEILTRIDMGDRQTGLLLQKKLFDRFFVIFEDIVEQCGLPRKLANLPIRLEEPVYGSLDQNYVNFVTPGFLLTVTFFLATSVSSSIIISDRHEGVWDRSLVQGVKTSEILLSHLLTQCSMILIQVTITFCVTFVYFEFPCKGSLTIVTLLLFLTGFCGMCYGFLISVLCTSQTMANFVSTGSFYPIILLCGCIWPVEGMPKFLRWISLTLPTTVPSISLRGILDKGYNVENSQVYSGFLIVFVWTFSFIVLCLFGLKCKSK